MSVSKRARKKPDVNSASNLLSALKFISLAQRKEGLTHQTHCKIADNYIKAFDGTLSIGCKIEEDLSVCPNTLQFVAALSKCGQELAITQLDNGRISVKSGAFRALVVCAKSEELISAEPDEALYPIDSRLIETLKICAPLLIEGTEEIEKSSVLLKSGSITATNGNMLIECWHGIDMPTLALPRAGLMAVIKSGKNVVKFGFSDRSMTFLFDDESWIKTQIFTEEWSDFSEIINVETNAWPVPEKLWEGIETIAPFSDNKSIFFYGSHIRSHFDEYTGAQYELDGIPNGPIYSSEYLLFIKPYAKTIDFNTDPTKAFFFGENIRGVIMGRVC